VNVKEVMTTEVRTCRSDDSLARAAQIMWDGDCGCIPVIADGNRVVGIVTDRDVCMSALLSGCGLNALAVSDAMSKTVHSCRADDSLQVAENLMRAHQIRRLPVVDAEEHVIGILSLNDVARAFGRERDPSARSVSSQEIAETLCDVCRPRPHALAA